MQSDRRRPRWGRARLSRRSVSGLRRRSWSWAAAVAAAPRQSWHRSWPAGGPKQAGRGRRRGGWCCSSTGSDRSAGQGVGGARGRPRGDPDEPVVHRKQHSGQGHTQEVGAHRGEPQPSAAGPLAQPGTTWALATTAYAARTPHRAAHSACSDPAPTPTISSKPRPFQDHAPSGRPPPAQPNPYILDTPLPPLTHHYQGKISWPHPLGAAPTRSSPALAGSGFQLLFPTLALSALIEPLPSSTDCSSAH